MSGGGTAAVVVAAGRGTRCEGARRKQFRRLDGEPVVARACRGLRDSGAVDWITLVLPEDVAVDPPGWLSGLADRVAAGGATRGDSVREGLGTVPGGRETVLVHDGVRPFATAELVRRVVRAAAEAPAVPAVPVLDTLKVVDEEGWVVETPAREALRRIQTPQGFPADLLREVHRRARREGWEATDDAALCERAGHRVRTVEGEPRNLKITTPGDLAYAEWLVSTGRAPGPGASARGRP